MHLIRFLVLGVLSMTVMSSAIPVTQNAPETSSLMARGRTRGPTPNTNRRPITQSRPRPVSKPKTVKKPTTKRPVTVKKPTATKPHPPVVKPPTSAHPGTGTGTHNGTNPVSCPIRKPTTPRKPTKKKVARALESFFRLFRRSKPLFIGWHGTNSQTAALWKSRGRIVKPGAEDGMSGANHEIGDGLYVTDTRFQAWVFARANHRKHPNTDPAVCAIYARNSLEFEAADKVWIPRNLVQDGQAAVSTPEAKAIARERDEYIKRATGVGGAHNGVHEVILFSELAPGEKDNQVMLPTALGGDFYAECITFKDEAVQLVEQFDALHFPPTGRREELFSKLRSAWHIVGAKNSQDLYVPPKEGADSDCTIA
ncbi:hypothetical protein EXIGLDRAFT_747131 [Exidia glandulosa HHB12029]|uniref:PARP catalytic domain-containing protein n=1 Tax=Exidia glandulosa HHB12029 TaxID=1314781 RepID=A0A165L515_EXIGL|nr:hypothetical protein EXIGLDRAFT_747131 [Exidia glandulosa HHB12029]